ncbi:MAG: hypothetical protein KFF77_02470 [Bacteroidetes bacterium]|nr:hypothetical protein [Bacteroidota bacterium]
MRLLLICWMLVFALAACTDDNSPAAPDAPRTVDTTLAINCPYVTAVTAELEIRYRAGRDVELYRDDIRIHVFHSLFKDTVFTDQHLEEDRHYVYSVVERTPDGGAWKRDYVAVRTFPVSRRSLDFQWLGGWGDLHDVCCAPDGRVLLTGTAAPLFIHDGVRLKGAGLAARGAGLSLELLPDGSIVILTEHELIFFSGGQANVRPLPQSLNHAHLRHYGGDAVVFGGADGSIYRANPREIEQFMQPPGSICWIYDLAVHEGMVYALIFDRATGSATLWRGDGHTSVPVVTDRRGDDPSLRIDDELYAVWVAPSGVIYLGGRFLHRVHGSRVTRVEGLPAPLPVPGIYCIAGMSDADFMILGPGPFFHHFNGREFHGEDRTDPLIPPRTSPVRLHLDPAQTVMLLPDVPDGPTLGSWPVYVLYARN